MIRLYGVTRFHATISAVKVLKAALFTIPHFCFCTARFSNRRFLFYSSFRYRLTNHIKFMRLGRLGIWNVWKASAGNLWNETMNKYVTDLKLWPRLCWFIRPRYQSGNTYAVTIAAWMDGVWMSSVNVNFENFRKIKKQSTATLKNIFFLYFRKPVQFLEPSSSKLVRKLAILWIGDDGKRKSDKIIYF